MNNSDDVLKLQERKSEPPDAEVEAAWDRLADERDASIASGQAHWVCGDDAFRELKRRLQPPQ